MEIGYDQGAAVRQLMCEQGFATVSVIKDLAGLDRVVWDVTGGTKMFDKLDDLLIRLKDIMNRLNEPNVVDDQEPFPQAHEGAERSAAHGGCL